LFLASDQPGEFVAESQDDGLVLVVNGLAAIPGVIFENPNGVHGVGSLNFGHKKAPVKSPGAV